MAHERSRFLLNRLEKTLKQSPSVSLLGMRQTGKTTLIKQVCATYLTLDDNQTIGRFQDGNWTSLDAGTPPIAIDECQKFPGLFDHIKLLIDQKKQMERFILTGSIRFLSKKQIKESLTGRTLILELLPMTIAESHQKSEYDIFESLIKKQSFDSFVKGRESKVWCSYKMIDDHLNVGGLPGICFKRDASLRKDLLEQHLDTLLSRDLQTLYQTKVTLTKLKLFIKELALNQGLEWSIEKTAKKIGVSAPTLRGIFAAFEGMFLIRTVEKRVYLEDAGLSHLLVPNSFLSPLQVYRSFVFRELFALLRYRYSRTIELSSYFTRGGVEVPFVLEIDGHPLGFTVDADEFVSEKSMKSLGKYKDEYPNARTIAFHRGKNAYKSSTGVWCLPMTWLV